MIQKYRMKYKYVLKCVAKSSKIVKTADTIPSAGSGFGGFPSQMLPVGSGEILPEKWNCINAVEKLSSLIIAQWNESSS